MTDELAMSRELRASVHGPGLRAALRDRLDRPFTHPAALAALVLLWSLVGWLRLTPVARSAIWAEDGRNFLADAVAHGPLGALLIPYAGYMHLLPRTIAGTASLFPIEWWAQVITALSCLVAGLVALLVYLVSAQLPIAPWSRLLLASVTVLTPTLVSEVLGNAANMYSFALWATFWLFLYRPSRWWVAAVCGAIALLLSGTAIQMVALVPLLAVRWSRMKLPVVAGFVAGLGLQIWGFTHSVRESTPSWPSLGTINDGYLNQVGMGSWIESAHVGGLVIVGLGWLGACLFVVPYVVAIWALWRSDRERRLARTLAIALPVASYLYWFTFIALNNLFLDYANLSPEEIFRQASTIRYSVLPSMFLWGLLIVAIGWRVDLGGKPRWWGRARVVVAATILLCAAVNFVGLGTMYRSLGPGWSESLKHAQTECRSETPSTEVAIPIAPVGAPWRITLSCQTIESNG
jgi:hypothetical protein